MGRGLASGTVVRACPNCFEELRLTTSSDGLSVSLTGRQLKEGDVRLAGPQADGDPGPEEGPVNETEPIEVDRDPWVHRTRGMSCQTCMCFVEKKSTSQGTAVIGRCRRRAPTMDGYPVVFPNDWCFEHKLDENKV